MILLKGRKVIQGTLKMACKSYFRSQCFPFLTIFRVVRHVSRALYFPTHVSRLMFRPKRAVLTLYLRSGRLMAGLADGPRIRPRDGVVLGE